MTNQSELVDYLKSLDIGTLNIKFAYKYEDTEGDVEDSLECVHLAPLEKLLRCRCIITVHTMSYLFNGSTSIDWKTITSDDIAQYPFVAVINVSQIPNKSHACFIFKADNKQYIIQSFAYDDGTCVEPSITELTTNPDSTIIWAPVNIDDKLLDSIKTRVELLKKESH